jgi:hypothetical protein
MLQKKQIIRLSESFSTYMSFEKVFFNLLFEDLIIAILIVVELGGEGKGSIKTH